MQTTKTILAVAAVIVGIGLASCGSDISGGVSLADAREECNAFEVLSEGQSLTDSAFNAILIQAEAFRDDGGLQTSYINQIFTICNDQEPEGATRGQCKICATAIAAVVWP